MTLFPTDVAGLASSGYGRKCRFGRNVAKQELGGYGIAATFVWLRSFSLGVLYLGLHYQPESNRLAANFLSFRHSRLS